ncbi:MAG: nucleotide exchange factor GrpE [Rickettsiaceae bacterium]|nr:nucleotide exchange factor GrpE [Rickettsiaceae bacterium]
MTEIQENQHETTSSKTHEQLEHQIEELNDKLLRSMAESENVRKRYEKQIDDAKSYSISSLAKDLIGVIDNLQRALNFKPTQISEELKTVLDGVELTEKELKSVLDKHGINTISPKKGEKFDYNLHFAISQVEDDSVVPDTIVDLMQVGYKIKDRLLRPAAVSVAKLKD